MILENVDQAAFLFTLLVEDEKFLLFLFQKLFFEMNECEGKCVGKKWVNYRTFTSSSGNNENDWKWQRMQRKNTACTLMVLQASTKQNKV